MKKKRECAYRIPLFVKFLTFYLLGIFLTLNVLANSSEDVKQKVTLKVRDVKVKDVLVEIKKQTNLNFFYNEQLMNTLQNVTLEVTDATVEDVLNQIFQGTLYDYTVTGNTVVIAAKQSQRQTATQEIVEGKVVDEDGQPLPGVNVIIKGENKGVSTDINGIYKIPVKSSDVLIFSCVGCVRCEKSVNDKDGLLLVRLENDIKSLDEVQVVAYGEQSKREVTGSISTIKADDLIEVPTTSVINLLQGKIPGASIVNMTGAPGGGGTTITIRGFNSLSIKEESRYFSEPLWVVDGVPIPNYTSDATGTGALADLDPNFIESIEILKDAASAAMYGSRAANGVILVTTKRGKSGRGKVSLNYSETFSFNAHIPTVTGGNMERWFRIAQFQNYRNGYRYTNEDGSYGYRLPTDYIDNLTNGGGYDMFWNNGLGLDVPILQDSLNPFFNNSTDWYDEFMRVGRVRNVNLQVSGANENSNYNFGVGYYDEKGVMVDTEFKRLNLIGNYTARPLPGAQIDNRLSLGYTDRSKSGNTYQGLDLFSIDPTRMSTLLPGTGSEVWEDVMSNFKDATRKNYDYRVRNNFLVSYNILPSLKISTSLGIDFWQNMSDNFTPSYLKTSGRSNVSQTIGRALTLLNENLITYKTSWKQHKFDALLGQSFQMDQIDRVIGIAEGGASDYIHYAVGFPDYVVEEDGSITVLHNFQSSHTKKTLASWFGRLNYVFDEKYLFSFTLRRDGSSTFGKNNRWGTFPSLSAGWIFSDEKFMNVFPNLTFGKIRGSWGKSGLHFSQPYLALGVYESSSEEIFLGQATLRPVWDDGLYNSSLSWEETTQYNAGVDLQLFNNKIGITADYYHRKTTGLLAQVSIPGANSYNTYRNQWRNAYGISNQGIEFKIDVDFFRRPEFIWEFSFNIARNWNRFDGSPTDDNRDFSTTAYNINIVGKPLNQIYVYKQVGIYGNDADVPTYDYLRDRYNYVLAGDNWTSIYGAGHPIYLDIDGDGKITTTDKVPGGSPLPKATGGFTNNFRYKNFDLNILFTYLIGRTILNATAARTMGISFDNPTKVGFSFSPILTDLSNYDFWSENNTGGTYPRIQADGQLTGLSPFSSANLEKVHFLRLKSLVFGYNLVKPFANSDINFRFFISGENLWLLTNYKGPDPETVNIVTGIDEGRNYPLSTRLTAGITINF